MKISLIKLAAATGALAVAPFTFANLLTNGSFEQGNYVWDGNNVDSLPVGSTVMTGWTVVGGETAAITTNAFNLTPEDGSVFLDLTGYHDSVPYGGVTQTVSTVVGANYALTFFVGVDNSDGRYRGPVTVAANVGGNTTNFTNSSTGTGNQWVQMTDNFTASSTSTAITLTGVSTTGGQYIGLDNVDLEQPVPEPLSMGMLSIGALGLLARKKRA